MEVKNLPIAKIAPSPMNPRKTIDGESLEELADNIGKQGLIQPITVRPVRSQGEDCEHDTPDSYEIVCGERRYRAFLFLEDRHKAEAFLYPYDGFTQIPAIIREMSDKEAFDAMITENLQRKDVDPMEEAFAFGQLLERGDTAEEVATRFGKTARFVQDRVKLNSLIPEMKKGVADGTVPIVTAQIICKLDPKDQARFYKDASNYSDFTKNHATRFTGTLFMEIDSSAWVEKNYPDFEGGCGRKCDGCEFNTSSHGCLFWEMKGDKARCTCREKFFDKTEAFMETYLSSLSDTLVREGQPLEYGKTVLSLGGTSEYVSEDVKELRSRLIGYINKKGFEVVTPSNVFQSKCWYDEDDERLEELIRKGEVYKVLQLFSYSTPALSFEYWYIRKDSETATTVNGRPWQVDKLLDKLKVADMTKETAVTVAEAKTLSEHPLLDVGELTEAEKKIFTVLVLSENERLQRRERLEIGSQAEDIRKKAEENPRLFNSAVRAWIASQIAPGNNRQIHVTGPWLSQLGEVWSSEEYLTCREKAKKKVEKEIAKLTSELEKLGYGTDGLPIGQKSDSEPPVKPQGQSPNDSLMDYRDKMKTKHGDEVIILIRVGDFYECFNEDADKVSETLGLTLTRNSSGSELCGFPAHALDSYLPKLVRAGLRVALCEDRK